MLRCTAQWETLRTLSLAVVSNTFNTYSRILLTLSRHAYISSGTSTL